MIDSVTKHAFREDSATFHEILKEFKKDQQTVWDFQALIYKKELKSIWPLPTWFFNLMRKFCDKEGVGYRHKIVIVEAICKIYKSIEAMLENEGSITPQMSGLLETLLETLVTKLTEKENDLKAWHKTLRDKTLYMHNAIDIAKELKHYFSGYKDQK